MVNVYGYRVNPLTLWGRYVSLPPNADDGSEFTPLLYCPNPSHDNSRSPAFQINLRKPLVHCFARCGIEGTYEHAISVIEGCSEREARKIILGFRDFSKRKSDGAVGERRGGRKDGPIESVDLAYGLVIPQLGTEYLSNRGIGTKAIDKWELGWHAEERRIVIPAQDTNGETRFLIRRAVRPQDHPKYLYTEGVERNSLLFGTCKLDQDAVRSEGIILVEGSLDAIRVDQNGFPICTAILGSFLSKEQVRLISRLRPKRVWTMFDKDLAGAKATLHAINSISACPVRVCIYPQGKSDPAELDAQEVESVLSKARSEMQFRKMVSETSFYQEGKHGARKRNPVRPVGSFR